jgi:hypothetical protein
MMAAAEAVTESLAHRVLDNFHGICVPDLHLGDAGEVIVPTEFFIKVSVIAHFVTISLTAVNDLTDWQQRKDIPIIV